MPQSMDNLLRCCKGKPFCVFSDLDYTCCLAGNGQYAETNRSRFGIRECFMNPDALTAFITLKEQHCPVFFVTGRHWNDVRKDAESGSFIPDGALNDLLGGKNSPLAAFDAIAGHGRQIIENGRTRILKRSDSEEKIKAERLFRHFVNVRMKALTRLVRTEYPDAAPFVRSECKKHLCYINIIDFPDESEKRFNEIFSRIKRQVEYILEGRNENGEPVKNAPPNPDGVFVSSVDEKGSVDIRSRSYNKGRALIRSGFMEKAFETGNPVLVSGDSLTGSGTDRDMFLCLKDFFKSRNASDRLFLVQVLNSPSSRISDPEDPCRPDIVLNSPDEFGKLMLSLSRRTPYN